MLRRATILSLLIVSACSQRIVAVQAEPQSLGAHEADGEPPEPYESPDTSFVARTAPSGPCETERELVAGKLIPSERELEALLGDEALLFVVLVAPELSLLEFPTNGDDRQLDFANTQRGQAIASSQACAIREVEEHGGTYVRSLWFTNGFAATLTASAARALSERTDVAIVELAASYTNLP